VASWADSAMGSLGKGLNQRVDTLSVLSPYLRGEVMKGLLQDSEGATEEPLEGRDMSVSSDKNLWCPCQGIWDLQ
jgi:hypothetical protein